jgi:FkbM family methyltransferase
VSALAPRRALRRVIARVMPAALKAGLQGRLHGYHRSRVAIPIEFGSDASGLFVDVEALRLRFLAEERADLDFHLVLNGSSTEEISGFLALARSATVLFDVGAAKALFSRLFCLSGPDKKAVAYEPSPSQIAMASRAMAANGLASRILVRDCAVGSRPGPCTARLADDGVFVYADTDFGGQPIEVELTSLDDEVERLGVVPDLIKIDVEGFENEVIAGARHLLKTRRPPICLELHLGILESRRIPVRQVIEQLQEHGYRFRTHWGRNLRPAQVWDSLSSVLRLVAY